MVASRGGRPPAPRSSALSDLLLHPSLWRWLLFAGQPVRLAIAANVFMGRSLRSLAYELAHRLRELVGWLAGRLRLRRLAAFERRYFQVRRWHAAALGLAAVNLGWAAARAWRERTSGRTAQRRRLARAMATAPSYGDWFEAASAMEALSDRGPAQQEALEARLYNRRLVQQRLRHLRAVRERGDVGEMMFALRSDLLRNLGNMASPDLHEALLSVPAPIRDYIAEVRAHLTAIAGGGGEGAPSLDERLAFLRETRHAFGRTALVLSGGGSFGSFHLGVVDALLGAGLLPRVLSGSSAGAIVAALVCTRTPAELEELFADLPERLQGIELYASNTAGQVLRHLVLKGTLQDHTVLQERLRRLLGDVTFQEAYARSGRILNVSVSAADTAEPPRLLNYLTAPNVIVWSAVAASSAFPFLFAPATLLARDARGRVVPFANQAAGEAQRRWRDGSLEEDLPMRGLSETFNVNYFLVSQANPYLLPILALKRAAPRTVATLAEQEFKHRCKQLMEVLPRTLGASRVLKLLSQPWEGDVTMVLPASSFNAIKAVVNLSRNDLLLSLAEGQRAAWAKVAAVAANCDVEVALDESLRAVTASARRERARARRKAASASYVALPSLGSVAPGGGGMRAGIPSWLHLQALGLPHSDSRDTLEAPTPKAAAAAEGGGGEGAPFGRAPFGHVPRVGSLPLVHLTDTAVPEDAELPAGAANGSSGGGGESAAPGGLEHPEGHDEPFAGGVEELEDLEVGVAGVGRGPAAAAAARAMTMSLGCGDDVWRDLFTVVPATTAGAGSDALDFIAP